MLTCAAQTCFVFAEHQGAVTVPLQSTASTSHSTASSQQHWEDKENAAPLENGKGTPCQRLKRVAEPEGVFGSALDAGGSSGVVHFTSQDLLAGTSGGQYAFSSDLWPLAGDIAGLLPEVSL